MTPGTSKNTYGTGRFLLTHTGTKPVLSRAGLLTTVACGARGEAAYALEGRVFIAGAAIQWLRGGLGLLPRAAESEAMARSVADSGGVVMVPAFVGLGAPYWRRRRARRVERVFRPRRPRAWREAEYTRWKRAVGMLLSA